MAKLLSVVNFNEIEIVGAAARRTGSPVIAGTRTWWCKDDEVNKVAIYTDAPREDHDVFFGVLGEMRKELKGSDLPEASGLTPGR